MLMPTKRWKNGLKGFLPQTRGHSQKNWQLAITFLFLLLPQIEQKHRFEWW